MPKKMVYFQTEQLWSKYPLNLPKTNNIYLLDNGRMNAVIKKLLVLIARAEIEMINKQNQLVFFIQQGHSQQK
jgi:hypothetical protein